MLLRPAIIDQYVVATNQTAYGYRQPIPCYYARSLAACLPHAPHLPPFIQTNDRAYLHRTNHFNGAPQRLGEVQSDIRGYVSELLSKAVNKGRLDDTVTQEDKEKLLEGLKGWGVLDNNYR